MLKILDKILKVILVIALSFAAIMIAWAGVEYITRSGEGGEKQTKVKTKIIYAAVGLVVAFLAWVITVILSQTIGRGVEI
jgi:TRAP-type C4-dicarboxylate transport system permease small subunit